MRIRPSTSSSPFRPSRRARHGGLSICSAPCRPSNDSTNDPGSARAARPATLQILALCPATVAASATFSAVEQLEPVHRPAGGPAGVSSASSMARLAGRTSPFLFFFFEKDARPLLFLRLIIYHACRAKAMCTLANLSACTAGAHEMLAPAVPPVR
jgi:hypothetical protein